jgi:FMN phosphatase YigB (HAD superfamily)
MAYETVFWDFSGVLSKDYFYKPLKNSHPQVWEFIQTKIFGPESDGKIPKWMRADLNHHDIEKIIIQETGIDPNILTQSLVNGTVNFEIETRHYPIVEELKQHGSKVGLVTDNMDVFDNYLRPQFKFESVFDVVISSFSHKKLKAEGLFDIAMNAIGSTDYSSALLIEDSLKSTNFFKSKGGHAYVYTTFEDFQIWADQNLLK